MPDIPSGGPTAMWVAGILALCLLAGARLFSLYMEMQDRKETRAKLGDGVIPCELDDSDRANIKLIPRIHETTQRVEAELTQARHERIEAIRLIDAISVSQQALANTMRDLMQNQAQIATLLNIDMQQRRARDEK